MRNLCLAAILCLIAPLLACAEDAPSAPPKADAPSAAAVPAYPLKSENFKDIAEGDEITKNGKVVGFSDPDNEAENIEPRSLADIFTALKATPDSYLKEHANLTATSYTLVTQPGTFRGDIVKLTGAFQIVAERELDPPLAGVSKYWKGQLSGAGGTITTFISLDPVPANFEVGRAANIYGVFMKRYLFHNRLPGDKGTWSPLVICHGIEYATDFERPASNWMFGPIGIGGLVLIGGIVIYFWLQSSGKGRVAYRAPAVPRSATKPPASPAPPTPPTPPAGDSPPSIPGKAG